MKLCPNCSKVVADAATVCPLCRKPHYMLSRPSEVPGLISEGFNSEGVPFIKAPRKDSGMLRSIVWLDEPEERELLGFGYDASNPTGNAFRAPRFTRQKGLVYAYGFQLVEGDFRRRMALCFTTGLDIPASKFKEHPLHRNMIWRELIGESDCRREFEDGTEIPAGRGRRK